MLIPTGETAMILPNYDDMMETFIQSGMQISVSEIHGIMAGFICADKNGDAIVCLNRIMEHEDIGQMSSQQMHDLLFKVYAMTEHDLKDMDFKFQLLLPDDESDIEVRAHALGQWCAGFINGLELAGVSIEEESSDVIRDILMHFLELTEVDYEDIDQDEEYEVAYMEVYEYIRLAVIMLYNEYLERRGQAGKGQSVH